MSTQTSLPQHDNERAASSPDEQISCGIYRVTEAIADDVGEGILVYYHNHGDPGPGVYLPRSWKHNRAVFQDQGITLPYPGYAATLEPLLPEGLYRVHEPFYCCEQRCHYFEDDLLVQLGYNAQAEAIVFVPELVDGALAWPAEGTRVSGEQLNKLSPLKVAVGEAPEGATLQ